MSSPKRIYQIQPRLGRNDLVEKCAPNKLEIEHDYYLKIMRGEEFESRLFISHVKDRTPKPLKTGFVKLDGRLVANTTLDASLQEMLMRYCYVIELIAPRATYNFYLPKVVLEAVDKDETKISYDSDYSPLRIGAVKKLVLLQTATQDVPIFKLYPPEYGHGTFVTSEFYDLYQDCNESGLQFEPVEVGPWWEAYI